MFTYFFVAVLQSSYLCLLLCCCFAVLHLAFTSDPARWVSFRLWEPRPRPHPRQEARAGGARGWLVYVWEWKKRALPMSHDLLPSNKPEEHSDPAFGIATNELEIEAGTFCLSIFLGDCLYTNLMRSRLAWVFDGGAKIWSTILGQVTALWDKILSTRRSSNTHKKISSWSWSKKASGSSVMTQVCLSPMLKR